MLNRLVPLLGEVEVPTKWDVITGGNDVFELTKHFTMRCTAAATTLQEHVKPFCVTTSRTSSA